MHRASPAVPFSRRLVRVALVTLVAVVVPLSAQVPGPNVNMISIDKYLQKQNEVDLTVSPRNPCHIVGAANDYRTVNNRGLNADGEIGDSWIGMYVSTDCGDTWLNYIVPGYTQGWAGADPMPRFGPGGGLYLSYIRFSRSSNFGSVNVARYLDYNDIEGVPGPPTGIEDQHNTDFSPVRYLGTTTFATGSAGQFLDKPSIAVARGSGAACSVTDPAGKTVTIPSTNVYVAWTEFIGNSPVAVRTKVYFARSTNCGRTLAGPATKLSEGVPINQGTVIAVHPTNPNVVYVAWRQVAFGTDPDAILFAMSTDGGRSFTKALPVPLVAYQPFDQWPTTSTTFRTLGYPTMVMADNGRLYLAVSARTGDQAPGQLPDGTPFQLPEGRILVTSTTNGVSWETPVQIETPMGLAGHQIMPALAYAGGRLNLIWYDLRYDRSDVFRAFVDETDVLLSSGGPGIRHTLDVRGAQADVTAAAWPLTFNTYGISQTGNSPSEPRVSQYLFGVDPDGPPLQEPTQQNFNRPNLKLYSGGYWPFMGDYIGTAGLQWLPPTTSGGPWRFNGLSEPANTVLRTFQGAWTDNRDAIVGPAADEPLLPNSNVNYTPPGSGCVPGQASSRNANVYTSRITPGLYISVLGNSKAADTIERAYAVQIENGGEADMAGVSLSVAFDPANSDGVVSFTQPSRNLPASTTETIDIPRFSSVARTVYIAPQAGKPYPRVLVEAQHGDKRAAAYINGDPQNPQTQQPGNTTDPITGKDTHTPRVANDNVNTPRVANDNLNTPRVANPRVANENVKTSDVESPRVANENPKTPRVANPRVANPRVANQGLEAAPFSDVTFDVVNDGNTTSAFRFDVRVAPSLTSSYLFQLLGWRPYRIPIEVDCTLVYTEVPQILFNVPSAPAGAPDDVKTATGVVRPGETLKVTLRGVWSGAAGGFVPLCEDVDDCLSKIEVTATAQAANTDETRLRTSTVGSIGTPDLTIEDTPQIAGPFGSGEVVDVFEGGAISVTNSVVIKNIGTAPTGSGLGYAYYLVSTLDVSQRYLIGSVDDGPGIAADGSYTIGPSGPLTADVALGSYRLEIVADYTNHFVESNEANNSTTSTQTIRVNAIPSEELVDSTAGTPSR